jgi:AraC-like DNA-binding protein
MKLYIKYMVSRRCKIKVEEELDKLKLHHGMIDLGEVEIKETITPEQLKQLQIALSISGLELMDDKKVILIEKVKTAIIYMVHHMNDLPKMKNSEYISKQLDYDYGYIAAIFSEVKGITIEHYIIANKIERVKELLLYDEFTLSQIAHQLNYSSVAHLSGQFKKVTGLTPRFFKQLRNKKRYTLESL